MKGTTGLSGTLAVTLLVIGLLLGCSFILLAVFNKPLKRVKPVIIKPVVIIILSTIMALLIQYLYFLFAGSWFLSR